MNATYAAIYIYSGLSKNKPINTKNIISIIDTPARLNDKIVNTFQCESLILFIKFQCIIKPANIIRTIAGIENAIK